MEKAKKTKLKGNALQQTEFTLGLIIIILFVAASIFTDNFCTLYNITNLMKQCAIIGVMAAAQTIIIITGGIDISGGAITGLSCMALALLQRNTNMNFVLTLTIALVIGVAVGFLNGIIIFDLKVPPMIATLGMQTIVRGFVKIISNALTVTGINQHILNMGNTNLFGVLPVLAIFWAVVAVAIWFILKYTIFGRSLYVVGSGVEVARLSGIKVRKMFYATYAAAGLLYGIAGIMLAARVQSALPTGGEGYDMNAIAAAVIGGASLTGGKGTITGTVLGTILMVLINNAGVQFGLNTHVLEITSGVLIIFAVTMDMLKNRKKA
ncbi:ABC transporter permease [Muricomes intestini]|jgi:ribose transport system permease protein|uniref:Monosaccharide ABC transporter membrane protein (CUT2 family) n=3 Tax=Muricomes intestini TaxID=1796634 RepID=A0A4R3K8G5_9FIRM|nr:ABC transporter permease [Muricomes intestini]TCS79187.1 monosaccharide ABC transporter membrane protein (CUT2 family) [Muricomes intestini]